MPLFFIISGMLINYKKDNEKNLNELIKKRFRSIMIPYFWFSFIYICIVLYSLIIKNVVPLNTLFVQLWYVFGMYGMNVLWFLPALFIGEITAIILVRNIKIKYLLIPVSLLIAIIVYFFQMKISYIYDANIEILYITSLVNFVRVFIRGIIASFFVVTGYCIFNVFLRKNECFSFIELIIGIVLFIVNIFLSKINGCVDFHYIVLRNVPMFFISAILGSMAIILISKNIKPIAFIQFFGKNSLAIMATHIHCYVLYAGIRTAWFIDTFVTRAKSYIFMFNIMVFTMIFECITVLILNKFFPFVLGKNVKHKGE